MRNTALFFALAVGLLFCSCNPKISTQLTKQANPLSKYQEVTVIDLDEALPSNSEVIGEVSISNAKLTANCSYEYVVELAKEEARKSDNAKITEHEAPDMTTTCHRISAQILMVGASVSRQMAQNNTDTLKSQPVATDGPYIKMKNPRIRFSLYGGPSQMVVNNPELNDAVLERYYEDLNSGYNIGTDFTYYFSDMYGLGLKCNMVRTSNSLRSVTFFDEYERSHVGPMSDDITELYVGPSFSIRKTGPRNMGTLYCSASAGFNGYYNEACAINVFTLRGATTGANIDVGYDINMFEKFALALKVSLTTGLLKNVTVYNGSTWVSYPMESNTYVSLNHIDVSIGFSFLN